MILSGSCLYRSRYLITIFKYFFNNNSPRYFFLSPLLFNNNSGKILRGRRALLHRPNKFQYPRPRIEREKSLNEMKQRPRRRVDLHVTRRARTRQGEQKPKSPRSEAVFSPISPSMPMK
jgi:hypothetical protein